MNPAIFNTILTVIQVPCAFVRTIWYCGRKNKANFKVYMIYWLLIIPSLISRIYNLMPYTLHSLFLHCMLYIWLQSPFLNGSAIIFNIFAYFFKLQYLPIGTDFFMNPIFNNTVNNYKKFLKELPHPNYSEDSSPSADPSGSAY